jgi:hypothetical protein
VDSNAAAEAVREAERVVCRAQWRVWEELALDHLARTVGLARATLIPGSDVIKLVSHDGKHLGHVRRDTAREPGRQWVAVRKDQAQQIGAYVSAAEAASALARTCGC